MRIRHNNNSVTNQVPGTENSAESGKTKNRRLINHRDTAITASEEDVFARLVSDEVARTQTSEVQTSFQALVDKQLKIRTRADGSVNLEKVMKGALKWASNEKQKLITADDADKIYSRTFSAAQLDSNTEALDDSSVPDATMSRDAAFDKARLNLEKLVSGATELPIRNLQERVTSSLSNPSSSKKVTNSKIEDILLSNLDFQI